MKNQFKYGEDKLTPGIALKISNNSIQAKIGEKASQNIETSHKNVQKIIEDDRIVYGINTGFGPLCSTKISKKR